MRTRSRSALKCSMFALELKAVFEETFGTALWDFRVFSPSNKSKIGAHSILREHVRGQGLFDFSFSEKGDFLSK